MDNNELQKKIYDIRESMSDVLGKLKNMKESRLGVNKNIEGIKVSLNSLHKSKNDLEQAENKFNKLYPSK